MVKYICQNCKIYLSFWKFAKTQNRRLVPCLQSLDLWNIFVLIVKCICPNIQIYLSKLTNISVRIKICQNTKQAAGALPAVTWPISMWTSQWTTQTLPNVIVKLACNGKIFYCNGCKVSKCNTWLHLLPSWPVICSKQTRWLAISGGTSDFGWLLSNFMQLLLHLNRPNFCLAHLKHEIEGSKVSNTQHFFPLTSGGKFQIHHISFKCDLWFCLQFEY